MEKITLQHENGFMAEASVFGLLYGGQIISWSKGGEEFLFTSSNFSPLETTGSSDGFVSHRRWEVDTWPNLQPSSSNDTLTDLILSSTDNGSYRWPHNCEFRLRIALQENERLVLIYRVRNVNTNGEQFAFQFAYNTFFAVSDISEVRIKGLERIDYLDNLKNGERFTDELDAITIDLKVDRVYLNAPSKIIVVDHGKNRSYVIRKHGLDDVCVWNQWDDEKSTPIPTGLGEDEYRKKVCVEPAIRQNPKTLVPGEMWTGIMELSLVNSNEDDDND